MTCASAPRIALATALLAWLAACGSSNAATASDGGVPVPAPTLDQPPATTGVHFGVDGTLTVAPGTAADVPITVDGADADVTLTLEGNYGDASLNVGTLHTSGLHASARLLAPTKPATFTVRAQVAGVPDARLAVSVSEKGFGTLRISVAYAGMRAKGPIETGVVIGSTCDDLAKAAITDGAPSATGMLDGAITLASVPVTSMVSVTARLGHYARGCTDVSTVTASGNTDVAVTLYDVPLALGSTDLDASFTFQPSGAADSAAYDKMLSAAIDRVAEAFMPGDVTEALTLLDAMRAAASTDEQEDFDERRMKGSWNNSVTTWLLTHPTGTTLKASAVALMVQAKPRAQGTLSMHLSSPDGKTATIGLQSFGALDAATAGLSVKDPFAWTADSDDTVHLAGTMLLQAAPLVAHSADLEAASSVAHAVDVPSALALAVDCTDLAALLALTDGSGGGGTGPDGGVSHCDAACLAGLCTSALVNRWKTAADPVAAHDTPTLFGLTASAHADVGDAAQPVKFEGTWVGKILATTGTCSTKGMATAATPMH
jgi:hypothetical protein